MNAHSTIRTADNGAITQSFIPTACSRAQELILAHRKGFDGYVASIDIRDEARTPEAEEAHQAALEIYSGATAALFNYLPQSPMEASLIASHLLVHARLNHFDPERLFDFLESLAIAPVTEAPATAQTAAYRSERSSLLVAELDGVRRHFREWTSQKNMADELNSQYSDGFDARVDRLLELRPINVSEMVQLAELMIELVDYDGGQFFNDTKKFKEVFRNIASLECAVSPEGKPESIGVLRARYLLLDRIVNAHFDAANQPLSDKISGEIDNAVTCLRNDQEKIVEKLKSIAPESGWDADDRAEVLLRWQLECGPDGFEIARLGGELERERRAATEKQRAEDAARHHAIAAE
jgi:hypothetical protein